MPPKAPVASFITGKAGSLSVQAKRGLLVEGAAKGLCDHLSELLDEHRQNDDPIGITEVDISQNRLPLDVFEDLFTSVLLGVAVKKLRLFGCPAIDDQAIMALCTFLANVQTGGELMELHLSDCAITTAGWNELMQTIEVNSAFPAQHPVSGKYMPLYLRVENNYIDKDAIQASIDAGFVREMKRGTQIVGQATPEVKVALVVGVVGGGFQQKAGVPPAPDATPLYKGVAGKVDLGNLAKGTAAAKAATAVGSTLAKATAAAKAATAAKTAKAAPANAAKAPSRALTATARRMLSMPNLAQAKATSRPLAATARRMLSMPTAMPRPMLPTAMPGMMMSSAMPMMPAAMMGMMPMMARAQMLSQRMAMGRMAGMPAAVPAVQRTIAKAKPSLVSILAARSATLAAAKAQVAKAKAQAAKAPSPLAKAAAQMQMAASHMMRVAKAAQAARAAKAVPQVAKAAKAVPQVAKPTSQVANVMNQVAKAKAAAAKAVAAKPTAAAARPTRPVFTGVKVERGVVKEERGAARSRSPRGMPLVKMPGVQTGKKSKLPSPWEEHFDEEWQVPYFWNSATDESVWERPEA